MSDPSDPKWATDIANKKPLLSYSSLFKGANDFFDSGSATTSTSTTGSKRDTIYGHTNRIHLFTPGTFTGAISFVKNALSTLMLDGLVGVLWGGKNETITNSDSNKIIGSKKRVRVGYRFGNYQNWIGKAFSELWWKEERVTIGDRVDTIKGDIQTVIVNGEEKKLFNNTDKKTTAKIIGKSLGLPAMVWAGTTSSNTNAATGHLFFSDKHYKVFLNGNRNHDITFSAHSNKNSASLDIRSGSENSECNISSNLYNLTNQTSVERTQNKKMIISNEINLAGKQSLNLGVSRSTIRIKSDSVVISNRVDLGGPGIEVDEEERLAR